MPRRVPGDAIHTTMTDHRIVRRPNFTDPVDESHSPYTGPVVPFYGQADDLSLALANIRENSAEAVSIYRRLLARDPDNPALGTALGKSLLRIQNPAEAIQILENVLRLNPARTEARTHLAVAQALLGNHRQALSQLRTAVSLDPDDSLAWTNLGVTLEVLGDTKAALDAYTEAIRLQPDSSEAKSRRTRLLAR
jgi:cytochrome c-type biogenesis protein CcmH/NrfG